jgi:hypothetical protein
MTAVGSQRCQLKQLRSTSPCRVGFAFLATVGNSAGATVERKVSAFWHGSGRNYQSIFVDKQTERRLGFPATPGRPVAGGQFRSTRQRIDCGSRHQIFDSWASTSLTEDACPHCHVAVVMPHALKTSPSWQVIWGGNRRRLLLNTRCVVIRGLSCWHLGGPQNAPFLEGH